MLQNALGFTKCPIGKKNSISNWIFIFQCKYLNCRFIYIYVCGMSNVNLSFLRTITLKSLNTDWSCDYLMFWYTNGGIGRHLVLLNSVVFIVFKVYPTYNVDNSQKLSMSENSYGSSWS